MTDDQNTKKTTNVNPDLSTTEDTDLTSETSSSGATRTPGPPAPGNAASTGADEVLQTDKAKD